MKDSSVGRRARLGTAGGMAKPAKSTRLPLIRLGTIGALVLAIGTVVVAIGLNRPDDSAATGSPIFTAIQGIVALAALLIAAIGAVASLEQIAIVIKVAADQQRAAREAAERLSYVQRLHFTRSVLSDELIARPARRFRKLLRRHKNDIAATREFLRDAVREHRAKATEYARQGFDALAELACCHSCGWTVPDLVFSRLARLANLAAYCYAEQFAEMANEDQHTQKQIRQFLRDSRLWLLEHDVGIDRNVPTFYPTIERYFGGVGDSGSVRRP